MEEVILIDKLKNYDVTILSDVIHAHKIMSLESEKRDRIINAAMIEFTKGYRKANTDIIVQNAGISKGALFHYFRTKKELFLFLLKYALEIISYEYQKESFDSRDFLDDLWKLSMLSMKLTLKYSVLYDFLVSGYFAIKEEFPEELSGDYKNPTEDILTKMIQNIDESLFREDIDIQKACSIILWTMKGYSDSLMSYGHNLEDYKTNYEKITKQLSDYLSILRKTFYR